MLAKTRDFIPLDFFSHHITRQLANQVFNFYDEYAGPPSEKSLRTLVDLMMLQNEKEEVHNAEYTAELNELFGLIMEADAAFIKANLEKLLKASHMQQALLQSVDLTQAEQYSEAAELMDKASSFTLAEVDNHCISFGNLDRKLYIEANTGIPIPTGFTGLDEEMGGGLRPAQFGIFCGVSNTGKSQLLSNLAAHCVMLNKTFLLVTLEMKEMEQAQRIDACISGHLHRDISGNEYTNESLRKFIEKQRFITPAIDDCQILFRPAQEITVPDLRNIIKRMYAHKKLPDLILVDYADLFRATSTYGNMYEDVGLIYQQLKGLAQYFNIPLWTATQASREGQKAKLVRMEHTGESFKKAHIADTMYFITQTEEEAKAHLLRLYSGKQRHHEKGKTHYFKTFFERGAMKQCSFEEYSVISDSFGGVKIEASNISSSGWKNNKMMDKLQSMQKQNG